MKKWLLLLLGLLLILILSLFCFKGKGENIKNHLTDRLNLSYKNKGIEGVNVGVKGDNLQLTRDIILTGVVADNGVRDEAEEIAKGVNGVFLVDNRLKIESSEMSVSPNDSISYPQIAISPSTDNKDRTDSSVFASSSTDNEDTTGSSVVASSSTDNKDTTDSSVVTPSPYIISAIKDKSKQIILKGYVKDNEQHQIIIAKANSLFGEENVTDELKEANGTPIAWQDSSLLGLKKLLVVDYGEFDISDNNFSFKGYVGSEDVKNEIITNLTENLYSNYSASYNIDYPKEQNPTPTAIIVSSVSCQEEFKKLLSNEKIHFEYDKAVIKKESYTLLDNLIAVANKCPNSKIEIEGHTDSDGSQKYNQKLSFRRAKSVKSYLVENGIEKSRLKAVGYGELRPVATNKTSAGKEKNRRIEFNLKGVE